jgi:signal transduction histidine kinase
VRSDPALQPDNLRRLELIERELARVQELVALGVGPDEAPEEVSLGRMAAEVVEPFDLAGTTSVIAQVDAEVRLTVDALALWRLLGNLVGNAVRAAGPGGRVSVHVRDDGGARIEVHDDGPGMTAGPPGRAGLGLPTSRRLARRCGAALTFAPRPGGGTVAGVRFRPRTPDGRPVMRPDRALLHHQG